MAQKGKPYSRESWFRKQTPHKHEKQTGAVRLASCGQMENK
jgi:hypothetical protein